MKDWNTDFHGIAMRCPKYFVQIKNDEILKDFLDQDGVGSMEIAAWMKKLYYREWECELDISEKSLAIEILGHVYANDFMKLIEKLPFADNEDTAFGKLVESLQEHLDIIDCGEKGRDNNRFVWDALVPFDKVIFALSRKHA